MTEEKCVAIDAEMADQRRTPKTLLSRKQKLLKELPEGSPERGAVHSELLHIVDDLYQPYVAVLLRKRGFRGRKKGDASTLDLAHLHDDYGNTGEDVFSEVRKRIGEKIILRFDFNGPHVGEGGFRNFLKKTVNHIVSDLLHLVTKRDAFGRIIYTDEPMKDKKGEIKRDKKGNVLYKPVKIPEMLARRDAEELMTPPRPPRNSPDSMLLDLSLAAYLHVFCALCKSARSPWKLEMLQRLYVKFEDPATVMENLIKEGHIKDRRSFDTEKCRFLSDWMFWRWKLYREILTGPKVLSYDNKKVVFSKDRFVWKWLKDLDVADAYVRKVKSDAEREAGREIVDAVRDGWAAKLAELVLGTAPEE